MKKNPRRPKPATPAAIPPQLAGLVALITPPDADRSDPTGRALTAARSALRDALSEDLEERISTFIAVEAARGPWKDLHKHIDTLNEHNHPFAAGDYINVYSLPALAMGLALMYVYLTDGGGPAR